MSQIINKLTDLLEQATKEHSHYYVAGCCREAIAHIVIVESKLNAVILAHNRSEKSLKDILKWCEDREKMDGIMDPELRSFLIGIRHLAKDGLS